MQNFRRQGFCVNSNTGHSSLSNPWAIQCNPEPKPSTLELSFSTSAAPPSKRRKLDPDWTHSAPLREQVRRPSPPPMASDDAQRRAFDYNPADVLDPTWVHRLDAEQLVTAGYAWDGGHGLYSHHERGSRPFSPRPIQLECRTAPTAPPHIGSTAHLERREPPAAVLDYECEQSRGQGFGNGRTEDDAAKKLGPPATRPTVLIPVKRTADALREASPTKRRRPLRTHSEMGRRKKMIAGAGSDADISE
ncbi:hypothetical protein B0H11DRAFT_2065688 [Mycena galericulata]|nr:hypothetical protein B0H11DRAFT_2065688 [Mycena galericulata]